MQGVRARTPKTLRVPVRLLLRIPSRVEWILTFAVSSKFSEADEADIVFQYEGPVLNLQPRDCAQPLHLQSNQVSRPVCERYTSIEGFGSLCNIKSFTKTSIT